MAPKQIHTVSPSATAMDRAIALDLKAANSRYPTRVAFLDTDEPRVGREITAALDLGYAVVLVGPDGTEHIVAEHVSST